MKKEITKEIGKGILKSVTSTSPIVSVVSTAVDAVLKSNENSRSNAEDDHREFLKTAQQTNAKKASKTTKRKIGMGFNIDAKAKTASGYIGTCSDDETTYESKE